MPGKDQVKSESPLRQETWMNCIVQRNAIARLRPKQMPLIEE